MWHQSNEDRIRQLQDDLYQTRRAILCLLPAIVQEIAKDYYRIKTRSDAHEWLEKLVDTTIDIAWPYVEKRPYSGPRAYCPLCKGGTSNYMGEEGFLLPGGLRKHLLGEGNAYECAVLSPVRKLAASYWRPRVEEAEAQERAAAEALKGERRKSEQQFRVDPYGGPELLDEGFSSKGFRDHDSLVWAVDRLTELGFVEARDGLVRQFSKDYGTFVVYADPRQKGRIHFGVYRREQVEMPKSRRRWSPHHADFQILDSWRKDLPSKFEQRVQNAATSLKLSVAR